MKQFIFTLCACIALAGCVTQPQIKYIEKTVPAQVPEKYLKKTPATPPPEVNFYMSLSMDKREKELAGYALFLHSDLASCNNDKSAISKVLEEQRGLYGK